MPLTGKVVGYDPGGNDNHGVAEVILENGRPVRLSFATLRNAQAALDWFKRNGNPVGIGIDTLTLLSTGDGGWRPADRWLRQQYPQVRNSIVTPNYLQGSMALNGLAVMVALRQAQDSILVTETHPKVVYFHLSGRTYNYKGNQNMMNDQLTQWLGLPVNTTNDNEWDAVVSCLNVIEGISGRWLTDLHQLPSKDGESLVRLGGPSHYYWPL